MEDRHILRFLVNPSIALSSSSAPCTSKVFVLGSFPTSVRFKAGFSPSWSDDRVFIAAEILSRTYRRDMKNLILKLQVWKDTRGQDLIEYALMAGFVAVAAGAIMPGIATSISTIFSKVASLMTAAATQGS